MRVVALHVEQLLGHFLTYVNFRVRVPVRARKEKLSIAFELAMMADVLFVLKRSLLAYNFDAA